MTAATRMAVKIGKMRIGASHAGNPKVDPFNVAIYSYFTEAQGSRREIYVENQRNGGHIVEFFSCLTFLSLQKACGI